jgi:3'-phosphoadenosine 5'-phosphosulfate (PAPS) 3'-phosphatase
MTWILYLQAATLLGLSYLIFSTERHTMSTQESIDAIVAQLAKAKDEILTEVANIQAQLDDAQVEEVDLSGLTAIAQALDDLNPEIPTEVETTDEALDYAADTDAPVKGDGNR